MRAVLQIVGEARAGKSTLCRYVSETYGLQTVRVSKLIEDYATTTGMVLGNRDDYLTAHRRMKQELGNDVIARRILGASAVHLCVDGMRVPNDAERLRVAPGVISRIVALHCPPEIRFERALQEQSGRDRLTPEAFAADDLTHAFSPDPEAQNTSAVMEMADYHLDATGPKAAVFHSIDEIVKPLLAAS